MCKVGRTWGSVMERLLLDLCELLLPCVPFVRTLFLVLAIMDSRNKVRRYTNRLHLYFPCLLWNTLDDT